MLISACHSNAGELLEWGGLINKGECRRIISSSWLPRILYTTWLLCALRPSGCCSVLLRQEVVCSLWNSSAEYFSSRLIQHMVIKKYWHKLCWDLYLGVCQELLYPCLLRITSQTALVVCGKSLLVIYGNPRTLLQISPEKRILDPEMQNNKLNKSWQDFIFHLPQKQHSSCTNRILAELKNITWQWASWCYPISCIKAALS